MKKFLILLSFLSIINISCSKKIPEPQSELVLGTVCTINLYENGSPELYRKLFARLREINAIFDVHSPDSELSKVNAGAYENPVPMSKELSFVVNTALNSAVFTGGYFNPVLGPLIRLWDINGENPHVPLSEEIRSLPSTDIYDVVLLQDEEKQMVRFKKEKMSFDLGGIAKGYACDELVRILKEEKVSRAMIYLGGNVYVYGKKPDGKSWRVGVRNPLNPDKVLLMIETEEATVVSSGNYERFFEQDGVVYHHILDPYTGFPSDGEAASVTVICKSSILADVLSTYIFIAGREGLMMVQDSDFFSHFECIIIEKNGKVFATKALEGKVTNLEGQKIDFSL